MPFDNRNINDEMSESFLNEFKERMAVDPLAESVRHVGKNTSNKQAIIILVLIVLAVCAGVCWNFYSSYISGETETTNLPVLKAKTEPIKVRPAEPGGMPVRDMDKTVYRHVAKYPSGDEHERILPAQAKPVAPAPSDNKGFVPPQPIHQVQQNDGVSDEPSAPVTVASRPVASTTQPEPVPVVPVSVVPMAPVAKPQIVNPTPKTQPISVDKKPTEVPVKNSATAVAAAAGKVAKETLKKQQVADDSFKAQLISVKSRDAALRSWQNALRSNKALLIDVDYEIVETAIPGKGTYYRLRVGNFATKDEAAKFCTSLKASGQDCIVVKK